MYNIKNAYATYNREKIITASPVELIIMLYDEMIKQLKMTSIYIEENKIEKANASIKKSQDIICELVKSLDVNYEIGQELMAIYDFINASLINLNLSKNKEEIAPMIDIMTDLKQAWTSVKQKNSSAYVSEV